MSSSSAPLPFGSAPSKLDITGKRKRPAGDGEDGGPNKKVRVSRRETYNQYSKGTWFDIDTHRVRQIFDFEDMPPFWHVAYKRKRPEAEELSRKKVKLSEGPARQQDNIDPRNRIREAGLGQQPPHHPHNKQALSHVYQNARPESYQQVITRGNEVRRQSLPHPSQPSFNRQAPSQTELKPQHAQDMSQMARGIEKVPRERAVSGTVPDRRASLGGRLPNEGIHGGRVAGRRGPGSTTRQPEQLQGVLHRQNNLQATLLTQHLDPNTLKPRPIRRIELARSSYPPGQRPRGLQDRGFQTSEVPGDRQIRGSQDNVIRSANFARSSDQQGLQGRDYRTLGTEVPRNSNVRGKRGIAGPQNNRYLAEVMDYLRVPLDQGARRSHTQGHGIQGLEVPETLNMPSNRKSTVLQKGGSHAHSSQHLKGKNALKRAAPHSDTQSAPVAKKARSAGLERGRNKNDSIYQVNDFADPSTFDTDFRTEKPNFPHPSTRGDVDSLHNFLQAPSATNGIVSQGKPLEKAGAPADEQPFDLDASIQGSSASQSSFPEFDAWLAKSNGNVSHGGDHNEVKESEVDSKDLLRDFDDLVAELNGDMVSSAEP